MSDRTENGIIISIELTQLSEQMKDTSKMLAMVLISWFWFEVAQWGQSRCLSAPHLCNFENLRCQMGKEDAYAPPLLRETKHSLTWNRLDRRQQMRYAKRRHA
jgi:hypothetical protein